MQSTLLRTIVAACGIWLATGALAISHTTLNELRSFNLKQLESNDPLLNASALQKDAAVLDLGRRYISDLFDDQSFIRATEAWLKTSTAESPDQALEEWAHHYALTLSSGLLLLRDDEVDFLATSLLHMGDLTEGGCRELVQQARHQQALVAKLGVTQAVAARLFNIFKRVYLAALANETPKPRATESEFAAAVVEVLTLLSTAERQEVLKLVDSSVAASPAIAEATCRPTVLLYKAINAASPRVRSLLQRHILTEGYRTAFLARWETSAPATAVTGAASAAFEPGAARLEYPREAMAAEVTGSMLVKIWVDAKGRANKVQVVERNFNKDFIVTPEGARITVEEMFDPVVSVYYKAGRFALRFKDSMPQPYIVHVPLDWKLE